MEEQSRGRVGREEWAKRVERWRDSGLTCGEFAAELGVNARTLTYWKWILGKEAKGEKRTWPSRGARGAQARARQAVTKAASAPAVGSGLIEIHAAPGDSRFELELGGGRRVRVPSSFDAAELRRLLTVLEAP